MTSAPEISVIIPVLREGEQIHQTLAQFFQPQGQVKFELIVVDGDDYGSTIALIPPELADVRSLLGPCGRGRQMNAGAAQARGSILLFLHADARLPPQALDWISTLLQDSRYAGGAFDLQIDSPHWLLQLIGWMASWRSRLTRIPYGDQGIFIRRDLFVQVGGYAEIPIMEDVALMRTLKQRGEQICISRDRIRVSSRRWDTEGVLYCTLRNWFLLTLYFLGVSPHRLAAWYRPAAIQEKRRI